jgi:hypothetical protein
MGLYKFNPILLKEFDDYLKENDTNDMFGYYIDFHINLENNQIDDESYDRMMAEENENHEKIMKQYDDSIKKNELKLAKLEHKYFDKEMQLRKAQAELASVTKANSTPYNNSRIRYDKTKLIRSRHKLMNDES